MIKYNPQIINKINSWQDDDIYVISDFDRTLSSKDSISSWGLITASRLAPQGFMDKEQALFNHYRPIEIDQNIPFEEKNNLMIEWWTKLINALKEYEFSEDEINNLMNKSSLITFRDGAKDFLESLYKRNIPIIILSAGLGDAITHFLQIAGASYPNVHIVSNFLEYEDSMIKGIKGGIIHTLNKSEDLLSEEHKKEISGRKHIILLGDQVPDIHMVSKEKRKEALKIVFFDGDINNKEVNDNFDIVASADTSFDDLAQEFPILKLKK